MSQAAETAAKINAMDEPALRGMDIFDRYDALMELGMYSDDHKIGFPERPLEEWKPEEYQAVLKLFHTWPETQEYKEKWPAFETSVAERYLKKLAATELPDKKAKLQMAADAFTEAAREVLGFNDFTPVELVFEPGRSPGYFGGLRPDGKIQICTRNLLQKTVPEGSATGDLSFVELVLHEATHKLQNYMAEKSDQETPDEYTNMLVARTFYESTQEMRKVDRAIYWDHPFETQARTIAAAACGHIQDTLDKQLGRSTAE